jgi:hypothetical protein
MYTKDEFGGYMCPDNAFQPLGGKHNPFNRSMRLWGGGKSSSPPDPNPGYIANAAATTEVANIQKQTATDYLNFSKQQYEEMKPTLTALAQQQIDIGNANEQRASEYSSYEKNTFRPLEQKIVDEANSYNTDAKREQLATKAAADVNMGYSSARDQNNRSMARFGINPNSGRFASLNNQLTMQQGADSAGAITNARQNAENLGYARQLDAANMGRGLASNASTAYGVSLNASNSAVQSSQAGANYMGNSYGQANTMYGQAGNTYGTAGQQYGSMYSTQMQGYGAQQQAQASSNAGFGALAGVAMKGGMAYMTGGASLAAGKADGGHIKHGIGKVSGPGGPVDDQVPAMLSDGEYVIPADVVKKKGVKYFDKIVKANHTPAKEQRKGLRRTS